MTELLERLIAQVRANPKYATIHPALIAHIGQKELVHRDLKEAVKATRRRLHQIGAVYTAKRPPYGRWLQALEASEGDQVALQAACLEAMAFHQSTRERIPFLERFYHTILGDLGPIHGVLDLACGLNPLAIPWMPLTTGATYAAYDIYTDLAAFLNQALPLFKVQGEAHCLDLLTETPPLEAEVALLLKTIPCLDLLDRSAAPRLLQGVHARYIVVSFPLQSLGGRRDRGMLQTYEARFADLISGFSWAITSYNFETELVFRIDKGQPHTQEGGKHA